MAADDFGRQVSRSFPEGCLLRQPYRLTLVALRPGLILCNPTRINNDTLPKILKQWKVIYSPPMENTGRYDAEYLSKCIGSD